MGSLAGGEQSARQPPAKLQLAKSPPPPPPEEEPEDEPEEPDEDPDEPDDEPDEPDEPEEELDEPDDEPDEPEEPEDPCEPDDEPDEEPDDDPELDPLPAFPSGRSVPAALAHAPSAATATTSSAPPKCPRSNMPASMKLSVSRNRAHERGPLTGVAGCLSAGSRAWS
jgi:hypothetical protein